MNPTRADVFYGRQLLAYLVSIQKLLVVLCGGELFNSPWVPEITVDGELSLKELLSGVIACDDRGSNSTQLNDAIDAAGEILFGSFMS